MAGSDEDTHDAYLAQVKAEGAERDEDDSDSSEGGNRQKRFGFCTLTYVAWETILVRLPYRLVEQGIACLKSDPSFFFNTTFCFHFLQTLITMYIVLFVICGPVERAGQFRRTNSKRPWSVGHRPVKQLTFLSSVTRSEKWSELLGYLNREVDVQSHSCRKGAYANNRDLKQGRQQRQRKRQKTMIWLFE